MHCCNSFPPQAVSLLLFLSWSCVDQGPLDHGRAFNDDILNRSLLRKVLFQRHQNAWSHLLNSPSLKDIVIPTAFFMVEELDFQLVYLFTTLYLHPTRKRNVHAKLDVVIFRVDIEVGCKANRYLEALDARSSSERLDESLRSFDIIKRLEEYDKTLVFEPDDIFSLIVI